MLYLIEPQALQTLRENQHNAPSASEMLAYLREAPASAGPNAVDGRVATIAVEGVLTPKPDLFARLFFGANTTYASIRDALNSARSDPGISHVKLKVSSPGGTVDGLFETLEAIKDFKASGKTMSVTSDFACSAAYGIAAVAGNISAVGDWATFGSVGVAASRLVSKERVDITSTDAPNKRPDLTTNEGRAVVRKELDGIHALFVRYIAEGRGLPTSANFGKGGTVLAREALGLKMIDSIGNPSHGGNGARAASGSVLQQARELIASMGDRRAAPDFMIEPMQGERRSSQTMSREERVKAVADIVCGVRSPDFSWGSPPHDASRDPADIVADFVCGDRGDRPRAAAAKPCREALPVASDDPADIVADIVCGLRCPAPIAPDKTKPMSTMSPDEAAEYVANIVCSRTKD